MNSSSHRRVSVLFPFPFNRVFDYLLPESLIPDHKKSDNLIGAIIQAPFGKKNPLGVIWFSHNTDTFKEEDLKTIHTYLGQFPLPFIEFIDWVARYTLSPKGLVLKMALYEPALLKNPSVLPAPSFTFSPKHFNTEQQQASIALQEQILAQRYSVSVLDGVTGSGKTDVYFSALEQAYNQGKQSLVLLPEISLTPQWLERFKHHFGNLPLEWHSDVSLKNKKSLWHTLFQKSEAHIVIGARSALFLPFRNLGLIIVDEEHENAYKQEEGVLYHARDMAIVRAKLQNIPLILASATPSLETVNNIDQGRYKHVTLMQRYGKAVLPDIYPIDMRAQKNQKGWISPLLHEAIKNALDHDEQVLLFLNRRGYAPVTLCKACGHRLQCRYCDSTLVDHGKFLLCHLCGHRRIKQIDCEECKASNTLIPCGPGVNRLQEEVTEHYPQATSIIISSDTLKSPKAIQEMVTKVKRKEVEILIGTQMIAKGHDFSNLTVVGIIDADLSLGGGDPRAAEKTFQLLSQVSGRAGRGEKKGAVYVQTYQPHHPVIEAFLNNKRSDFLQWEKETRKTVGLPPFGKLAALILSGKDRLLVEKTARMLVQKAPFYKNIQLWGPAPAPLSFVRSRYRWRLLIKTTILPLKESPSLQDYIDSWLKQCSLPSTVKVSIDIDPYSFL